MPYYDYRCGGCKTEFEVWRAMSDESTCHCPECGEVATQQFSPAAVVFKGTGFYKTDSRKMAPAASGGREL